MLDYIVYAESLGYIPIVDMKYHYNQYFKDGRMYKDNAWEYFFKQPAGYSIDDLTDDAEIKMSLRWPIDPEFSLTKTNLYADMDNNRIKYQKYFDKIQYAPDIKNYLESNYKKIIGDETEILGILCRGTDYLNIRPYGHAIQPDPQTVINKAKELLKKYNYKKIWLATEDADIYDMFKKEFKDILIENPQYRYRNTKDKVLSQVFVDRKDHNYNLGKEYLLTMYILSKCKYFIGGVTCGTHGLWLLSNAFKNQKYVYLWQLGSYKSRRKIRYSNFLQKIFSAKTERFEDKKYYVLTLCGIRFKHGRKTNSNIEYINNNI